MFAHGGNRWNGEGGYRELLAMAVPLILSTGAWTVQYFIDAMFLAWYSPEAVAAVLPAGVMASTVMSLFVGVASYTTTFVAQYTGAGRDERVGEVVWHGLYVALLGGAVVAGVGFLSDPLFRWMGHEPRIARLEAVYFRIICLGAAPAIAAGALAGFFAGRGQTWPIMWVNVLASLTNLGLDYVLIFGRFGFPKMGVAGAATATVMAGVVMGLAYLLLMTGREVNRRYQSLSGWRFQADLFGRLIRFGLPSGMHLLLDIGAFSVFVLILGRLGTDAVAASNIAFNINTLAFMPMVGIGMAVSTLMGQRLAAGRPAVAQRTVYSAFHVTLLYMGAVSAIYVLWPDVFILPFSLRAEPSEFAIIRQQTIVLLRFVALYSLFDTMNVVFAAALKGAGDTRYVMLMAGGVAFLTQVLPCFVAIVVMRLGILTAWTILTVYVIAMALAFLWRFLTGKWKTMRVTEEAVAPVVPNIPGNAATRYEPI